MKKTAIFGVLTILAGCQTAPTKPVVAENMVELSGVPMTEPAGAPMITGVPCSYSCPPNAPCGKIEPMVLKPRVREVIPSAKSRPCCDDVIPLFGEPQTYIPDAPEIYVISANRTVNSMLKEAEAFYNQIGEMNVYVDAADVRADDLPGGSEQGIKTLRKRFAEISNVNLMESADQAQYIVSSAIDWYDTATKTVPAIKYDLFLKSKDGRVIGEWSEIIHQTAGDRSWW